MYLPQSLIHDRVSNLLNLIQDYFQARESTLKNPQAGIAPYKPLPPRALYLTPNEWKGKVEAGSVWEEML